MSEEQLSFLKKSTSVSPKKAFTMKNTFDDFSSSERAFSIKILDSLYFENKHGLNVGEIYSLFRNHHSEITKAALEKLLKVNLVCPVRESQKECPQEKRYEITALGEEVVLRFYDLK